KLPCHRPARTAGRRGGRAADVLEAAGGTMRSENGILVDVGEVAGIVDKADVLLVGFANFSERLLVDTRSDRQTRPLIRVVPSLGSYQDRIFWLGQNRPTLGMPNGFSFLNWPHS